MSRVKCKYVSPGWAANTFRWLDLGTGLCYHTEHGSRRGTPDRFHAQPSIEAGDPPRWGAGELTLELVEAPEPTPTEPATSTDLKFDGGKAKWSLLRTGCTRALQGVILVLMFGAKKYEAHSWQKVENGAERYRDALDRHLAEIDLNGMASCDEESGELHIYHVACNALFLAELQSKVQA